MQGEGAWIFMSHSHLDYDKVRALRNELEIQRYHPLMFFLKCLNDDSEVDGLVRREIEAREWFLLCESTNSRGSHWVTREVEIIKTLSDRVYESVNLEADLATQVQQASKLAKRATVFLSYAHGERDVAGRMAAVFRTHDYGVFIDINSDLTAGQDWMGEITARLDDSERQGFVLVLMSPNSVRSEWVRRELKHALVRVRQLGRGYGVVPVLVGSSEETRLAMDAETATLLGEIQWADFSKGSIEQNTESLIRQLKGREMR
jgi:TIR domain